MFPPNDCKPAIASEYLPTLAKGKYFKATSMLVKAFLAGIADSLAAFDWSKYNFPDSAD
jgi:hypothetical protein